MQEHDISQALAEQVQEHYVDKRPLSIEAGNSKKFYGHSIKAEPLDVRAHSGIITYEPTELVLTARCGTPLAEIETALAQQGQMLGFEPPHFTGSATLGGCIASGLSGPRRPYSGSARDFVLGMRVINGRGEILHFGGEVMKNVAGYDVARLMTGALGTLGIILEVSLKVLPEPHAEQSVSLELEQDRAIALMNKLAGQSLPLSAACYDGRQLYLRASGSEAAVRAATRQLGGEAVADAAGFWQRLREHTHAFFQTDKPLWRLSLAPTSPLLTIRGKQLLDWGGAQRWLVSDEPVQSIRHTVAQLGGHATLFRARDAIESFHPLHGKLNELHMNLKLAFDPHYILNPGRMYPQL